MGGTGEKSRKHLSLSQQKPSEGQGVTKNNKTGKHVDDRKKEQDRDRDEEENDRKK